MSAAALVQQAPAESGSASDAALVQAARLTCRAMQMDSLAGAMKQASQRKTHPACFPDEETFLRWKQLHRDSNHVNKAASLKAFAFCIDCTREYQAEMKDAGRCENPTFAGFEGS